MAFSTALEIEHCVHNGCVFLVTGWVSTPDVSWRENEASIVRQEVGQRTPIPRRKAVRAETLMVHVKSSGSI